MKITKYKVFVLRGTRKNTHTKKLHLNVFIYLFITLTKNR